jgi:hypothetical protein
MQAYHVVCAAFLLVTTTASGQERAINVRTAGTQSNAVVAAGPQGFVVVWNSYYSSNGRSYDILARLLDPNGEPMGGEFQVNQANVGNQSGPTVAVDSAGGFAVAWQGPGADQEDVYVRLYDCNGQPRSEALVANEDPNGRQLRPRVAAGANGGFAVVWENRVAAGDDDVYSVWGRWFEASGQPLGPSLRLDEGTGDARYPDVATDARGNVAVVWLRDRTSKTVFARLFDPNGTPQAGAFEVSSWSFSSVTGPSVAMNKAGSFVIAWDGNPNWASDDDVLGRCYDPNGRPKAEPFRVNAISEGAQQWPQVAINDANEFVVVWQHETQDANTATDILSRRFDGTGNAIGEPLQLNTYVAGHQRYPDVTLMPDGSFAAVWESEGQDGSGYGIRACVVR